MTTEQYKRAVEINERIKELNEVKKAISGTDRYRLSYSWKDEGEWRLCPNWVMSQIGSKILDKHDQMIRQEIDDEIAALKAEIERL